MIKNQFLLNVMKFKEERNFGFTFLFFLFKRDEGFLNLEISNYNVVFCVSTSRIGDCASKMTNFDLGQVWISLLS